ncbi:MAG TPA: UDP-N-acetylmuramate dehydrogenase, partial [Bacteroidales bacterium]
QSGQLHRQPLLLLGGGSNILFTKDVDGLVVKINITGREILFQDEEIALVRVAAGETWDEFVAWSLEQGFNGLENLSLIPGNIGSSPIQNIGAYGIEVKDCVEEVEVMYLADGRLKLLSHAECRFAYRDSIFKHELKGKVAILSVTFRLNKSEKLNLAYGAISRELEVMDITAPTSSDVREAVCQIRKSKLPDPAILGNAGSFFKNPTASFEIYNNLVLKFPSLPSYPQANGSYKLAAGWLIEQCGWKGFRVGDAGVHAAQALVLVNYGTATGKELLALATEIQQSVLAKFGIKLEMEVNIL